MEEELEIQTTFNTDANMNEDIDDIEGGDEDVQDTENDSE